jgi:hypothetical protein
MTSFFSRLRRLWQASLAWIAVLALGLSSLMNASPALADAGRYLTSSSYQELTSALQANPKEPRHSDLEALEVAIASSGDRAQLNNDSSHSVGVFARYKKDPATQSPDFYVLGPGHETDDDYELVGVYVPSNVTLAWGEGHGATAAAAPRVARILEGQQLTITDPEVANDPATTNPANAAPVANAAATQAVTYNLSLPVFSVDTKLAGITGLPSFNQGQLDQELETAPLD